MAILNLKAENDCQEAIKAYLVANVSDILAEKINKGVKIEKDGKTFINKKTLTQFWNYASKKAQEMKTGYVANETVFGWAIHFFEEDEIEGTLYNEDGTEYKPTPKPVTTTQRVPAPTVPTKPTPPKPQQFTLFDMLSQTEEAKTDEPMKEEIEAPIVEEISDDNDGEVTLPVPEDIDDGDDEEPTELNVDMETGEILPAKATEQKSVPLQQCSPLYQNYMKFQEKYPRAVIAYRLGDFFEVFGIYATHIADELNLTLTGRDCGLESRVPMVGFPYHAADTYFRKITERHDLVVVEDGEATLYHQSKPEEPIKQENEATVYENNDETDDFEEERALQQFFDKDALCSLYELFDYNLDMQ